MRKLLLVLIFAFTSVIVFAQAAPVANMRIANATTAVGVNVPVGFIFYDVADNTLYVCKTATASTLTLTTGAANFQQISLGASHNPVTINATANGLSVDGSQVLTLAAATSGQTGALTSTDWSTFNNKVTSISAGTGVSVTGTTTVPIVGVDTSAVAILGRVRAANTYQAKGSYQTTTLTNSNILVGNGSNVAASVAVSGDATISNTGGVTVANSAVIGKVLTGYSSGAGTVAATDNILQAVQKLNGNQAASAATIHQAIVEDFEMATADSAATGHYYYSLGHTPIAGTIQVQVNGGTTKLYSVQATSKIRTGFSLGQFDKLQVSYSY